MSNEQQQTLQSLPVPDRRSIMVVPLGGTSRVGMNATLIGHAGRWIMVDVGATFAGADDDRAAEVARERGGVLEQIIPDFRALSGAADRIDGIVLTHAHEDHVGGIPPLYHFEAAWPRLARARIYATPYTLGIVREKIRETGRKPRLGAMTPGQATTIGPFEITPVRMTHSAPETCGLIIRVRGLQPIFLATDFKLDRDPVLGGLTDMQALARLGREGVMAVLADSTNAQHAGWSTSEGEVRYGLSEIMARHQGRVVVSTFASNLARIVGICEAAAAGGRRIAGKGRSILRNVEVGYQTGVLRSRQVRLLDPRDMVRQPRRQVAMVCTGTQAEPGSALQRLADDLYAGRRGNTLGLQPGDLIVHSARVIPGNEATVRSMFDTFRSHGVQVMEAGGPGPVVHASGHARRDELAELYRALAPRFAVPMHGHRELTAAHEDLALSLGIEAARSPSEGEVMRISPLGLQVLGRFEIGTLATLAVGGRNAGETRLIGWERASSPELSVEHKPAPRQDGTRRRQDGSERAAPKPEGRPQQPARRGRQSQRPREDRGSTRERPFAPVRQPPSGEAPERPSPKDLAERPAGRPGRFSRRRGRAARKPAEAAAEAPRP